MRTTSPGDPGAGIARSLLRRLGVELHPGEAPVVLALFGAFFLCLCFQYASKSVRQATFVDSFGAERLPIVYLAVALLTLPIVYLYGRLADRLSPARLTILTCGSTAGGLAVFWWLYGITTSWVPFVFYLWITVVIALNLSQIWAFAAQLFDPRQAKRVFAFLGAGGLLGGIAGGQTAVLATQMADTRAALLAGAIALVAAAFLVAQAARLAGLAARQKADGGGKPARALAEVARSPQLRMMAIAFGLSIVVAQIVDLQFNWVVERATSDLDQRTAFFGNFYSVTGLAAVVFQLLLTSRIQRSLGVGFALRVLPVTLTAGTIGLLIAGGFFPALLLAAGLVLKVGENGLRYSLDQATRELLFLPVPGSLRIKAKAVIDVLVQRGAKGLAAFLLLPVFFGWLSPVDVGWLSLVLIGAWLVVLPTVYRRYVDAYRESLRGDTVDPGLPIDLTDARTLEVLIQSLGSADSRQVLHALALLISHNRGHLVPPLLLYHDDPQVRRQTLEILAAVQRDDAMPLVERRLRDEDPEVRAAAIHALASLRHVDACSLMLPRLDEPDPAIRAAAIACVANLGDEQMAVRAGRALADMLRDDQPQTRVEAARCLGALPGQSYNDELLELLYDRYPAVVREAISSVRRRIGRDGASTIYMPTLISLLRERRLKHEVRESLVAFGESAIPALVHFLNDVDEHVWVRRAIPKTLTRIGTMAARAALVDTLAGQHDPFLRRKIVEALNAEPSAAALAPGSESTITAQIVDEAASYLQILADLDALEKAPRGAPALLCRLLRDRLESHLQNLFGLLALLHPPEHIWAAHRSLTTAGSATRGHALEYLDNTLTGDRRRAVFAAIEAQPTDDKLDEAQRLFGTLRRGHAEVLASYLDRPAANDADSCFLGAAALHGIFTTKLSTLYPEVHRLAAEAKDPFVEETALWVVERIADGERASSP
jgi:AAA family ATP:ADP antiporter